MDTDVLIHEATNSLTSDDPKGTTYEDVETRTIEKLGDCYINPNFLFFYIFF